MTLTFKTQTFSCTHINNQCTNFQFIDFNSFYKIYCLSIFPHKSIREQIWPCLKVGQGQPRTIIWTNFVGLTQDHYLNKLCRAQVPNAVYHVSKSSATWFRIRRFLKSFHIWAWQPSWWCNQDLWINFHSAIPRSLQMKFGSDWPSGYVWKWWTPNGRQMPTYTINSPMSLKDVTRQNKMRRDKTKKTRQAIRHI